MASRTQTQLNRRSDSGHEELVRVGLDQSVAQLLREREAHHGLVVGERDVDDLPDAELQPAAHDRLVGPREVGGERADLLYGRRQTACGQGGTPAALASGRCVSSCSLPSSSRARSSRPPRTRAAASRRRRRARTSAAPTPRSTAPSITREVADEGSPSVEGDEYVNYTFRIDVDYKQNLPEEFSLGFPVASVACGMDLAVGDELGILLDRFQGQFLASACSVRTKAFLDAGVASLPDPLAVPPSRFLAAGGFGAPRVAGLDADGRVVGYGGGPGGVSDVSVCPGGDDRGRDGAEPRRHPRRPRDPRPRLARPAGDAVPRAAAHRRPLRDDRRRGVRDARRQPHQRLPRRRGQRRRPPAVPARASGGRQVWRGKATHVAYRG